ncbi:MAG: outer membrane beta-barrel protein [Rikenellaceae bacterium]
MRKHILFILTLTLFCAKLFAQENNRTGVILNSANETLAGAMITCISLPDSTASAYAISDDKGCFQIKVPNNKTILEITYLGYEKMLIKAETKEMTVHLKEATNFLGEVTVKARSTVKKEAGKFIYAPIGSDYVKGIDSYELMKYAPLLNVMDGKISMLGKGRTTIYINGRLPVMGQSAVMDMLKTMPADRIEKMEIITSPGSSYKASTGGGIVNIILKKDPNQGLTGRASVETSFGSSRDLPRTSLYLGYAKKKLSASTSFWFTNNRGDNEIENSYNYKTTGVSILGNNKSNNAYLYGGGNINLEYEINKKSKVGASFSMTAYNQWSDQTILNDYFTNNVQDSTLKSLQTTTTPKVKPSIGATVYYNLQTDSLGSNVDITANYSSSFGKTSKVMDYLKRHPDGAFNRTEMFRQTPSIAPKAVELKATYAHNFKDDSYMEVGFENNSTRINNDFVRENWNGSAYVNDDTQSNIFVYDEIINALYINYDRDWTDAFSTSVGLRGEHTHVRCDQRTQNEKFTRNYFNVFPQISMSWNLKDGDHNLSLDLGSSIIRPYYTNLNPYKIWTSPDTYTVGNKDLNPLLSYNADFMYVLKSDYIFGVNYRYGKDDFADYTGVGENNTTMTTTQNFGNSHEVGVTININKVFFNGIWQSKLSLDGIYQIINGSINSENVGSRSWYYGGTWNNIVRLSKKHRINLEIFYIYNGPFVYVTRQISDQHLIYATLKKTFKFGGTLEISAENLLNTRDRTHYDTRNYAYRINTLTDKRRYLISYSQTFGKSKVRGANDRSSYRLNSRTSK